VNISPTNLALCGLTAATIVLSGCANYQASGSAAASVSGTARSESRADRTKQSKEGEFYNTETMAPGIGSALFPDPAWR
jgi:hypothetical protein